MTVELSGIVTIISVAFAVFAGIMAIRRNNKTDDRAEATQITTVIVKLESIGDDIKEIKKDMRGFEERLQQIDRRLTIVEQSAKAAHNRLDIAIGSHEEWRTKNEEKL